MSFGTIRLRQTPKLEWQTGGRCQTRADLHYFLTDRDISGASQREERLQDKVA